MSSISRIIAVTLRGGGPNAGLLPAESGKGAPTQGCGRKKCGQKTKPQSSAPTVTVYSREIQPRLLPSQGLADLTEVFGVEVKHLLPAVYGGLLPVAGTVDCKEAVACVGIHMELVVLAVLLQRRFGFGYVGG